MLSTSLRQKLTETQLFIQRITLAYQHPAILWSGGKDSMAMLNIFRMRRLPVVLYRHAEFPEKYLFIDRIIREWDFDLFEPPPMAVTLQNVNGTTEMVWCYRLSDTRFLMLPTNMLPIDENASFKCGLTFKSQPTQKYDVPWDVLFIGHKSCDTDPTRGSLALHTDLHYNVNAPDLAFPLKDWTHDDVWEYTEEYQVPVQETRYERIQKAWTEKSDKTFNPDCLPICVRCVDKNAPSTVRCPLFQCELPNFSSVIPYLPEPHLTYFGTPKETVVCPT